MVTRSLLGGLEMAVAGCGSAGIYRALSVAPVVYLGWSRVRQQVAIRGLTAAITLDLTRLGGRISGALCVGGTALLEGVVGYKAGCQRHAAEG